MVTWGCVGRVGALAVALGVGGAILALPAIASGDTGDRSGADTARDARTAPRGGSAPADSGTQTTAGGRGATTAHRSAAPEQKNRSETAAVTVELPSATPDVAGVDVAVRPVAQVDAVAAPAAAAAPVTDAPSVVAATPAAEVAVATAIPQGALAAAGPGLLDWLDGGNGTGTPLATPLAWAVVAVTRRESSTVATAAAPAAPAPAAAAADLGTLATALGNRVAGVLTSLAGSLTGGPGATLVGFLNQSTSVPGVSVAGALGIAAANVLRDAAGITRVALPGFGGIDGSVVEAIGAALSDPALAPGLASAASSLIVELAGNPAVRTLVAQQLSGWVTSVAGNTPLAGAVGDAAAALLASPAVVSGLAAVAQSAITEVLGQPAISAALSGAVGPVLDAARHGDDLSDTVLGAIDVLRSDPAVAAALSTAVRNTLAVAGADLWGNAAVQQVLGQTVSTLFGAVAADPALLAAVVGQFSAVLGPDVAALVGDPAVAGDVAVALGSAVTGFLGQPGVAAALTGAAGGVVDALLLGADPYGAAQAVFAALKADPAVAAAVGATISAFVGGVMDSSGVLDVIGGVTEGLVDDVLDQAGLSGTPAGEVAKAAVTALLDNAAIADLVGDIAADVLGGQPVEELAGAVVYAVITEPDLQAAVGSAVGQAIGALFGDNPIGAVVGWVAGGAATVAIGFIAGIALLFNLVPAPAAVLRNEWPVLVVA